MVTLDGRKTVDDALMFPLYNGDAIHFHVMCPPECTV